MLTIALVATILYIFVGLGALELFHGQAWFYKIIGDSESYGIGLVILAPFFFGAVVLVTAVYMYIRDFLKKSNEIKDSI